MKRIVHTSWIAVAVSTALLGLAGCETTPETSGLLEQARGAVDTAESDPNVTRYAPTELDRARKLLVNAEDMANEKGAEDKTASHYAYLATQMARISQQRAQEQASTARIRAGETERQQILLTARESDGSAEISGRASAGSP